MHISLNDADGDLLVRDALVAAFFCRRPYPELAGAFGQAFEDWLGHTPGDAKRWAVVGPDAEEYRAFSPRLLTRLRAAFDPTRAKTREMEAVKVLGPQKINAEYKFTFEAARDLAEEETNVLEIRSPSGAAAESEVETYVDAIRRVAAQLPYESGYASLALTWGVDSQTRAFAREAKRWAFRHPGFDIPDNLSTRFHLGAKLRGAYWLTFIGPGTLRNLGGEQGLRKAVPAEVTIEPVGFGVMLRASALPEVGDVNRMQNLPVLRALAKALQPVLLLGDNLLDNNFVDEESRARWERRLLD